jgi:hypothetical protein
MFDIFKKSKPKQKIIWDYIPIRPSTKAFNFEGGKDLKDYLVPTREILPKWFKSLKQTTSYFTMFPNVRTCPSFIDLFKDSYTFVAPCDIHFKIDAKGVNFVSAEDGWFETHSHTAQKAPKGVWNDVANEAGALNQMGSLWDQQIHNIKFMTGLQLGVNHGEFRFMQLPSYWHNPNATFFTPPGISTVTEANPLDLQLNTFIDFKKYRDKNGDLIKEGVHETIKVGTPMGLIFLPDGYLPFEHGKLNKRLRKRFLSDYTDHLKEFRNDKKNKEEKGKCPFPFLH